MSRRALLTTAAACRAARVDRVQFNNARQNGAYTCAPSGQRPTFDRDDIAALYLFGRLTGLGFSPLQGGLFACAVLELLREQRRAGELLAPPTDGVRRVPPTKAIKEDAAKKLGATAIVLPYTAGRRADGYLSDHVDPDVRIFDVSALFQIAISIKELRRLADQGFDDELAVYGEDD